MNRTMKQSVRRHRERGMTLPEIMVVIVIIGLVMSVVGVAVYNALVVARRHTAFIQIRHFSEALELYSARFRGYPSAADGLVALATPRKMSPPVMKDIPLDPWGNAYVYIYPGTKGGDAYDILSCGPDGISGTDDDITSWKLLDADEDS